MYHNVVSIFPTSLYDATSLKIPRIKCIRIHSWICLLQLFEWMDNSLTWEIFSVICKRLIWEIIHVQCTSNLRQMQELSYNISFLIPREKRSLLKCSLDDKIYSSKKILHYVHIKNVQIKNVLSTLRSKMQNFQCLIE